MLDLDLDQPEEESSREGRKPRGDPCVTILAQNAWRRKTCPLQEDALASWRPKHEYTGDEEMEEENC